MVLILKLLSFYLMFHLLVVVRTDETGLSKRIQAMKFLMAIKLETFSHKPVLVFLKVS